MEVNANNKTLMTSREHLSESRREEVMRKSGRSGAYNDSMYVCNLKKFGIVAGISANESVFGSGSFDFELLQQVGKSLTLSCALREDVQIDSSAVDEFEFQLQSFQIADNGEILL